MKKYFLLVDTESTITNRVADFAAIIVDKRGNIYNKCGVLVTPYYTNSEKHPLFHLQNADGIFAKEKLNKRYKNYNNMIKQGSRMIASVPAINRWLEKVKERYNPILTAYNLAFDRNLCHKSGIDLSLFGQYFCLWHSAAAHWATSRRYRQFILDNHYFNPRTERGNMTYLTNAEIMAHFVKGYYEPEPHTALEDLLYFELPILQRLVRVAKKKSVYMNPPMYTWRNYTVNKNFKVK